MAIRETEPEESNLTSLATIDTTTAALVYSPDPQPENKPAYLLVLYPRGVAQAEEERKAKGITAEVIEANRKRSLAQPF